jgi:hypothetical protein
VLNQRGKTAVGFCYSVDYTKREAPPNYKCHKCGATGCKLWRECGHTLLIFQTLLCVRCVANDQKKDISDIDANGTHILKDLGVRTDWVGYYIPAVPTEANDAYWGCSSVPQAGYDWWKNLPT